MPRGKALIVQYQGQVLAFCKAEGSHIRIDKEVKRKTASVQNCLRNAEAYVTKTEVETA